MNKKFIYLCFVIFIFLILTFSFTSYTFALGEPKIVNKVNSAFENIKSWILKIATPAAAVAVGSGVFMKKFSFRR